MATECKPFLKWAGGKAKLADRIIDLLGPIDEARDVYAEPFLGGGAVFFALKRKYPKLRCVLNDANEELIATYRVVRDDVEALIDYFIQNTHVYTDDEKQYYALRAWVPETKVEDAARMIYLNKIGFNGLYRVNKSGSFNVPYGRSSSGEPRTVLDVDVLRAASIALQDVRLTSSGASHIPALYGLDHHGARATVWMCDPPYHPTEENVTASFVAYGKYGFTYEDHCALAATTRLLAIEGRRVVVCNSNVRAIRELYQGDVFDLIETNEARSIACDGDRSKAKSLLIVDRRMFVGKAREPSKDEACAG